MRYNANQLQQILRRQAAKAFQKTELIPVDETDGTHEGDTVAADNTGQQYVFRSEVLDSDVIPLISAFAAQDKGDARQAIKYLRKAGEIADKNGAEMVTEQTVREAQSQVEKETVIEAMREMTTQAHLALSAIAVLEKAGDTPVRTKPVYGVYQNIADLVDADKLVQRRMRDHLLELDMQGIIDAQKKAGGSVGGPAWHFELQVNDDVVIDVLKDVSRLESIDFDNIGSNRASRLGEYS